MTTNWKDAPLSTYTIVRCAYSESDYNYYMYVHALGQIIILREKLDRTEYLYTNGGFNKATAWANRSSLLYVYFDELG